MILISTGNTVPLQVGKYFFRSRNYLIEIGKTYRIFNAISGLYSVDITLLILVQRLQAVSYQYSTRGPTLSKIKAKITITIANE